MTEDLFKRQIARLQEIYGTHAYPLERQKLFWKTFCNTPDAVFIDAMNLLIATKRSTPLHAEFHAAISEAWKVKKQQEAQAGGDRSLLGILKNAYNPAEYSDPVVRERIVARMKLVKDFTGKKITKAQFDEGCGFFDKLAGIETGMDI